MPTTLTYIPLTPTTPVPVEGSAQRFRVSRNDDLLCGGERGIWAAESSVGLRDAVRAAHIPFPCRGDTRVIPPHTLSSVATAGHNRVAEPPTARATSPDDESPTGDLSRAPHRLRLQICIPSRGWAAGPSQREPFRHPHNCTLFIVHWGDHPDHLGSSSWITYSDGSAVQHLHYLPWGEDFVDQRSTSWNAMYTFSAKEKDTETGYSYFGSRYYNSDLSIWLSVDPMSDKYPSLSPYTYCADNPVKLVDPDGEEIVIEGKDGSYIYSPGSECKSTDWKVKVAWSNLDQMYEKEAGKAVINKMTEKDSPSFIFTDESLYADGTGRFRKDDKGGGTMYMGGQLESVSEFAHELFHGYQELKGQGGSSIHNEVEAFLFAGLFSDKMSNGLFVRNGGDDQEYIQAVSNLLFSENYNNFDGDFKSLINGFKSQSSANYNKKYQGMDLYRGNQKEDLFKLLVK